MYIQIGAGQQQLDRRAVTKQHSQHERRVALVVGMGIDAYILSLQQHAQHVGFAFTTIYITYQIRYNGGPLGVQDHNIVDYKDVDVVGGVLEKIQQENQQLHF